MKPFKYHHSIFFYLAFFSFVPTNAQNLERVVISNGGNTITNNDISLSVTIGEPVTAEISNDDISLIQGMEQSFSMFTLSVIKISATELLVYPNPTSSTLEIRSDRYINDITLLDGFGKTIRTEMVHGYQKSINVDALPAGIYFIQIKEDENFMTTKFLKI